MLSISEIRALVAPYMEVPQVMGLCLMGSYASGDANDTSELDIGVFFGDEAVPLPQLPWPCAHDLWVIDRKNREDWAANGGWRASAFLSAIVLYDRDGRAADTLHSIIAVKNDSPQLRFAKWDAYLNGLYRSLKYHRKGREFGFRACAAESVLLFLAALYAGNALVEPLPGQEHASLWRISDKVIADDREQMALLLRILRDGDPAGQAALFAQVEPYLIARNLQCVIDGWEGLLHLEIQRLAQRTGAG